MNKPFERKSLSELQRYASGKVAVRGMTKAEVVKAAKAELNRRLAAQRVAEETSASTLQP